MAPARDRDQFGTGKASSMALSRSMFPRASNQGWNRVQSEELQPHAMPTLGKPPWPPQHAYLGGGIFGTHDPPRLLSLHLPGACLLRGTGDASNPGRHRLTALSYRTATRAVIWNFCDFMTGREESSIVPGACHPPAVIRALDSSVGVIKTSAMRQYARKASDGV